MLFQRCLYWSWQDNRRIHPVPVIKNLHFKEWQYISTSWIGDIHSLGCHFPHYTTFKTVRSVSVFPPKNCQVEPQDTASGRTQTPTPEGVLTIPNLQHMLQASSKSSFSHESDLKSATIWLCPRWTNFAYTSINSRKVLELWQLQLVAALGTGTIQKSEAASLPFIFWLIASEAKCTGTLPVTFCCPASAFLARWNHTFVLVFLLY